MTQNEAKRIISVYNGGEVPRKDITADLVVGRKRLLEAIGQLLDDTAEGGSIMKFLIGDPGFGKTCIMTMTRMASWAKGFVTMDADLSTDRRLYDGGGGKALALYKALMDSVSTRTRPFGGALSLVLDVGINNILSDLAAEKGMEKAALMQRKNLDIVLDEIDKRLLDVDGIDNTDFNSVVKSYFRGFMLGDATLKRDAVNWLGGCCRSPVEARQKLGVRKTVDDSNWYDMLKNFCAYAVHVGRYRGLTVMLDEAACLCDISGKDTRDKNIEKVKFIYNDCFRQRCDHLLIMVGGTVNFLVNRTRGLFGNEHLRSRLQQNDFLKEGMVDYSGPVLRLTPLSGDNAGKLMENLKRVFDTAYGINLRVTKDDIRRFRDSLYESEDPAFLSPRRVGERFLYLMQVMRQNGLSFAEATSCNFEM